MGLPRPRAPLRAALSRSCKGSRCLGTGAVWQRRNRGRRDTLTKPRAGRAEAGSSGEQGSGRGPHTPFSTPIFTQSAVKAAARPAAGLHPGRGPYVSLSLAPRLLGRGVLQARALEGGAASSSSGSSRPRHRTRVSRVSDRFFTVCATREPRPG